MSICCSPKKKIIKVGGKRVSPKEIAAVILSVPEVVDCPIEGVPDELLGETIRANTIPGEVIELEYLRKKVLQQCNEKLACHKIPRIISFKDHLDLSTIGKKVKSIYV